MRDLRYGIEIEMTGLSRGKAAETLAGFFGTRAEHTGGGYDAYAVRDAQGRVWKLVSDGSIQTQKKVRGQTVAADSTYSVELVSPVCVYEDIETIQEIVRALRRNNALVNDCALPGFVDSKNEEKTERNAGYLVVSHSGGGMLRQGTRKGIRRTPANRGMRAHRIVKSLDISEDVCHGLCP